MRRLAGCGGWWFEDRMTAEQGISAEEQNEWLEAEDGGDECWSDEEKP